MNKKTEKVLIDLKAQLLTIESYSELREVWDVAHSIFSDRQRVIELKMSMEFSIGDKVEWFSRKGNRGKWIGKITKISSRSATVDAVDIFGKKTIWKVGFSLLKKSV